jgi:pimeloyl-ACP methyl ester carboxylesterase
MSAAMTIVLIHGGGATGAFWDRLVPLLDGRPLVVDLPGRRGRPAALGTLTVEREVASVVADIEASTAPDGPVTLVAHSSGGLVVPGVADTLRGRVHAIVLNAALVPAEGECGIECMQERHRDGLRMAVEAAEKDGRCITLPPPTDPESLRRSYGGDPLDDDTLAFVTDPTRSVEDTVHHYFQPVRWSTVSGVPITYVLNERDRPIQPEMQEIMVQRLPQPADVIRVDSGHLLPVTSPALFAEIVNRAAA